jgi:hypothetical protein
MQAFSTALFTPTGGAPRGVPQYRFVDATMYEFGRPGSGAWFVIPAGYAFDLSAPRWLYWALPSQHMIAAAGVHDFARHQAAWPLWFGDLLFLDALDQRGVREPYKTAAWLAVRLSNRRD